MGVFVGNTLEGLEYPVLWVYKESSTNLEEWSSGIPLRALSILWVCQESSSINIDSSRCKKGLGRDAYYSWDRYENIIFLTKDL